MQTSERREGYFKGHQDLDLFYQTWSSPANAGGSGRTTLVITHGIAEHSESYAKTAEKLVPFGWNICAWDLRGHGRSEGKRGYVEDFRFYAYDLARLVKFLRESGKLGDRFALLGHSMGGLITLRHLCSDDTSAPTPTALCLSSPALGFSIEVPKIKDVAARVFIKLLPTITLGNEIKLEDLTRDPEFLKGYPTDPLRHDKISPAVYLGMIDAFAFVRERASRLKMPTLVQAAGQERLVSLPAIREYFPKIGAENKKLIVYDESYHEIFNDLDRDKVFGDLNAFLSGVMK